jgi:rare lipoprotein A
MQPIVELLRRSRGIRLGLACLALAATAAASPSALHASLASRAATPVALRGEASWYGKAFHGQRTASGEVYDMHALTAAHPELPLGSRLLVRNLNNGRSVQVRVNDRGPAVADRVLDLSYEAARKLGAIADGIIPVEMRVLARPRK